MDESTETLREIRATKQEFKNKDEEKSAVPITATQTNKYLIEKYLQYGGIS